MKIPATGAYLLGYHEGIMKTLNDSKIPASE
jgi:hypothetical protein